MPEEIKKIHGNLIQNPDGTWTATTNQGYTFTIKGWKSSQFLDEPDLLMAIVDALAQLLNTGQIAIGTQSGTITIPKKPVQGEGRGHERRIAADVGALGQGRRRVTSYWVVS